MLVDVSHSDELHPSRGSDRSTSVQPSSTKHVASQVQSHALERCKLVWHRSYWPNSKSNASTESQDKHAGKLKTNMQAKHEG